MTDEKIDLRQICLTAAKEIADGMKLADQFADKTDALKALTALYTAFRKHPSEDEEAGDEFDFAKGIQPASQDQPNGAGAPRVQHRRRPTAVS